jgi:integrase
MNASTFANHGGSMYLFKRENGIYYLSYEDGGKLKRVSTGKRFKQEALQFLRDFNEQQRVRGEEKTDPILLADFAENFLKYSESVHTVKTRLAFRVTFRMLEGHLGNLKLTELTTQRLEHFFTERVKDSSSYAARRDFINLSSAFNKAVRDKQMKENPCKGIRKIRIPEKLPLFFSRDEFQTLLSVVDKADLRDLIEFACNTGLRQMELLTLRWEQVNFTEGFLTLDNRTHLTKSKRIRTVPLNQNAKAILGRRERINETGCVFTLDLKPLVADSVTKTFKKYVIKAKLNPKLNFHSLRHTFASWLVQRGVSIYHVSKLLGHSSVNVTAIYSHLQPDNLREAVSKLVDLSS